MGIIKDNKKFDRKEEQNQPLNPKIKSTETNKKFDLDKEITKKKQ